MTERGLSERRALAVIGNARVGLAVRAGPGSDADSSAGGEWHRRAVRPHGSIGVPGLALDPERAASGARAHRVHRALQQVAASSQFGTDATERRTSAAAWTGAQPITLKRRDRLGGLLHEYERAA